MNKLSMSNALRVLSADMVSKAGSGHVGLPLGMSDVATVLYSNFLRFYAPDPLWHGRDRFILSAGHGSALLYSLLHLTGYEKMSLDQIRRFRQLDSITCGHPEIDQYAGIEATTGPLGQGLGIAVGMALAGKILSARYGDIFNHKIYVMVGDGCLMEGISHEVISFAGHLGLNNLICLYDQNHVSIDGGTSLAYSGDAYKRFQAENWAVFRCDAHNIDEASNALSKATSQTDKPSLVGCSSIIGKGIEEAEGTASIHGLPPDKSFPDQLRKKIGWTCHPFEIPSEIRDKWLQIGIKSGKEYEIWQKRFSNHPDRKEIENLLSGKISQGTKTALRKDLESIAIEPMATRKASQKVIEVLHNHIPQIVGGSADLTESNCTRVSAMKTIKRGEFSGEYIHYGVREHGMGAIMNGIALQGLIPYGGTFLAFTDYMRPSIRISALMRQKVIYICTHDSIGLGEDGPTHQPIEHLDSLRAMENLRVFRPADLVETGECWELALQWNGPSILALSRQKLPSIRRHSKVNLSSRGGYVVRDDTRYQATLIGTGSELHIAYEVWDKLAENGIKTRIVSLPCVEIFTEQDENYIQEALGEKPRFIIEAASGETLHKYVRAGRDVLFSMHSFGKSAPYSDLYQHFDFSSDKIYPAVESKIRGK